MALLPQPSRSPVPRTIRALRIALTPAHITGINIAQLGQAPQDDFSGYPEFGGFGAARWGDYSWGVADGGSLWLATVYIPGDIDSLYYVTNFGTYIQEVDLQ